MKRSFVIFILATILPVSIEARADMFGGDDAILAQILGETVQELAQMKGILQNGQNTLGLLQSVNRGINDSLNLAKTLGISINPSLYGGITAVGSVQGTIEQIFGAVVDSPIALIQRNTDQTVAESIAFNNDLNTYTTQLDQVGEAIKEDSNTASPGRAEKLTAATLGIMIHVMNQQIRATGQGLKLQAQALAVQNKREKDSTAQYLNEGQILSHRMTTANPTFEVPRF